MHLQPGAAPSVMHGPILIELVCVQEAAAPDGLLHQASRRGALFPAVCLPVELRFRGVQCMPGVQRQRETTGACVSRSA